MKEDITNLVYASLNYPVDDYSLIDSVINVAFGENPEQESFTELKAAIFKTAFMLRTFNKITDKEAYKVVDDISKYIQKCDSLN